MIRLPNWLLVILALALFTGLTVPALAADDAKRDQSADKAKQDKSADKTKEGRSAEQAQRDQNADTTNGQIQRVDADHQQIVVRDKNGADWTFEMAKDAKVQVNGKEGKLADLKKGEAVRIRYETRARGIHSGRQEQGTETTRGKIERVDAGNNRLVLRDRDGKEWTFQAEQNARVRADGQQGKLSDLKQGEVACIQFAKEGNQLNARRIWAGRQEQAVRAAQGKLERVDSANHELVLRDRNGKQQRFQVSQDARVRSDGQDSQLSDLKAGQAVTIIYRLVANDVHTPESK